MDRHGSVEQFPTQLEGSGKSENKKSGESCNSEHNQDDDFRIAEEDEHQKKGVGEPTRKKQEKRKRRTKGKGQGHAGRQYSRSEGNQAVAGNPSALCYVHSGFFSPQSPTKGDGSVIGAFEAQQLGMQLASTTLADNASISMSQLEETCASMFEQQLGFGAPGTTGLEDISADLLSPEIQLAVLRLTQQRTAFVKELTQLTAMAQQSQQLLRHLAACSPSQQQSQQLLRQGV